MAVTRVNINIPQGVWTDLYAASGIAVGTEVAIYKNTSLAVMIVASAAMPTTVSGIPLVSPTDPSDPLEIPPGEPGLWALSPNGNAILLVQEQGLQRHSYGSALVSHTHPKGMDFYTSVGLGLVPGVRRVTALGSNADVDQASLPEDVWSVGGLYPWMTAATSLEVVSTSASDGVAGVGARTITIFGLDINYVEVNQSITLDGLTPVAVPTNLFRINSILIMSAGTTKVNVGDINVRDAGGGTVRGQIPAGFGLARQAVFTVPAAHTLSVHSILFAQTRSGGVERTVTMATMFQSPNGFFRLPLEVAVSQITPYRHDGDPGIIVAEKTDFAIRVLSTSTNDLSVTAAFLGTMYSHATLALV